MIENIETITRNAKRIILITEKGIYVNGNKLEIMTLFSMLCDNLLKNGFSKEELKELIDTDLNKEVDSKQIEALLEKLRNFNKMLEELKEGK